MTLSTVRGMKDILPPDSFLWVWIEKTIREHFFSRGYMEMRTPVLERSELFTRSVGETTDIVEKEMYTFDDRSGDSISMRPEGTAPVVRSYLQNRSFFSDLPARLFYLGPMFRHERPQKGRLRQFHQAGAEVLGSLEPYVDGEVLISIHDLFDSLGLTGLDLEINSLGCPQCRPGYNERLISFLDENLQELCVDCKRRFGKNPLRVLDCKSDGCVEVTEKAPVILDFLCGECGEHFERVSALLKSADIPYRVNGKMVRGLDYYQRTAFEFLSGALGAQNAVAAGGRYDGLARMIGSREDVPGVGFAIGLERLLMVLMDEGKVPDISSLPLIFLALATEDLIEKAFFLKREIEKEGIFCEMDYSGRSLRSQMRRANRLSVSFAVILGAEEFTRSSARVKDMATGEETEVPLSGVRSFILGKIGKKEGG